MLAFAGNSLLNRAALTSQGLNFGYFNANSPHTFGFQLDKGLLSGVLMTKGGCADDGAVSVTAYATVLTKRFTQYAAL